MKLNAEQKQAIVAELVKKQNAKKIELEAERKVVLDSMAHTFTRLASIIKTEFSNEFKFLLNLSDRYIEDESIPELAKRIRDDYESEVLGGVDKSSFKSQVSLRLEVTYIAPDCNNFHEIVSKINPFNDEEK